MPCVTALGRLSIFSCTSSTLRHRRQESCTAGRLDPTWPVRLLQAAEPLKLPLWSVRARPPRAVLYTYIAWRPRKYDCIFSRVSRHSARGCLWPPVSKRNKVTSRLHMGSRQFSSWHDVRLSMGVQSVCHLRSRLLYSVLYSMHLQLITMYRVLPQPPSPVRGEGGWGGSLENLLDFF